jgi:uncharacterized protein (TIGR00375 family)
MALAVDLHSHSGYAGGAGKISLASLAQTMQYKGIDVFGVGDCLFPAWQKEYQSQLTQLENNLYRLKDTNAYFIRQTEVIFTVKLEGHSNRIIAHHIILFPNDESIRKMMEWLKRKGHKNTIARPFITCQTQAELEDSLYEIQAINPLIEIIPAHVLTPDGILGSKNNLETWTEFYGGFAEYIHAVETGLSADPAMLCRIPDLQNKTFISNSDCHSAALNRVGREFTILQTNDVSYEAIIQAIRQNRIELTAEFMPSEGRYYLTGHRADKHKDRTSVFFSDNDPIDLVCPDCGKKLLQGVKNRADNLSDKTISLSHKPFLHLVPLIEVIAYACKLKSIDNRKVQDCYDRCLEVFGTEISLWKSSAQDIEELLDNNLTQEIIQHIVAVRNGRFDFEPAGYDGCYGRLNIHLE